MDDELWKGKIIITSRLGYLSKNEEHLFTRNCYKLKKCFILPFSKDKIFEYIKKYAESSYKEPNWSEDKYNEELNKFIDQGLNELIREPFLLQLVLKILPLLKEKKDIVFTRFKVYMYFMENWFSKEISKLKQSKKVYNFSENELLKIMEEYSTELSFTLLLKNKQTITLEAEYPTNFITHKHIIDRSDDEVEKECDIIKKGWTRFFISYSKDKRRVLKIGLKGCPVKKISCDKYIFIHKSFYEYFASKKIIDEIIIFLQTNCLSDIETILNKKLLLEEFSVLHFINDVLNHPNELYLNLKEGLEKIFNQLNNMAVHEKSKFTIAMINLSAIINFKEYFLAYKIIKEIIDPPTCSEVKVCEDMFLNKSLNNINQIIKFIGYLHVDDIYTFIDRLYNIIDMFDFEKKIPVFIQTAYNIYVMLLEIPYNVPLMLPYKRKVFSKDSFQFNIIFKHSKQNFCELLDALILNQIDNIKKIIELNSFVTLMSAEFNNYTGPHSQGTCRL